MFSPSLLLISCWWNHGWYLPLHIASNLRVCARARVYFCPMPACAHWCVRGRLPACVGVRVDVFKGCFYFISPLNLLSFNMSHSPHTSAAAIWWNGNSVTIGQDAAGRWVLVSDANPKVTDKGRLCLNLSLRLLIACMMNRVYWTSRQWAGNSFLFILFNLCCSLKSGSRHVGCCIFNHTIWL